MHAMYRHPMRAIQRHINRCYVIALVWFALQLLLTVFRFCVPTVHFAPLLRLSTQVGHSRYVVAYVEISLRKRCTNGSHPLRSHWNVHTYGTFPGAGSARAARQLQGAFPETIRACIRVRCCFSWPATCGQVALSIYD
jgi:hypothetical protein